MVKTHVIERNQKGTYSVFLVYNLEKTGKEILLEEVPESKLFSYLRREFFEKIYGINPQKFK
jgi:hypothetical protein